jgi:hypothetical protein
LPAECPGCRLRTLHARDSRPARPVSTRTACAGLPSPRAGCTGCPPIARLRRLPPRVAAFARCLLLPVDLIQVLVHVLHHAWGCHRHAQAARAAASAGPLSGADAPAVRVVQPLHSHRSRPPASLPPHRARGAPAVRAGDSAGRLARLATIPRYLRTKGYGIISHLS